MKRPHRSSLPSLYLTGSTRAGNVKAGCLKRAQADLARPRFTSVACIFRAGNWVFLVARDGRETLGCWGKLSVRGGSSKRDAVQPREALRSVPGADVRPGEPTLVLISPFIVYTDRRNVLDPANLSG